MSITASNWKIIHDSPTNQSKSKMAYSFSRSKRFGKQNQIKSPTFYNLQTTITKRSTNFGYGNKYDFTKDMPKTPPPTAYNPDQSLKRSISTKRFCFGQGREEMTVTGPLAQTINNKNPGPGAYQNLKKESKIAYSIRQKVKQPQPQAQKIPGPGAYSNPALFTKSGSVFSSKHTNHKAVNFNSGGQRFKNHNEQVPGPGKYDTKSVQFSSNGQYYVSKLHNSQVRSFGHQTKIQKPKRCQTPGPGNYRLPSEFGYYISKKQMQKNQTIY